MKEEFRQIAHMFFGIIVALFIYFTDKQTSILILGIVVFLSVIISDAISRKIHIPLFSELIQILERENTFPGKGTIFFFVSTLFCLLFFEKNVVFAAVVVLAVLDSVTTIIGVRYGRKKIYNKKSLEGTAAGMLSGFIVLIFFISPVTAAITAFFAGIAELISPVDDNLIIPLTVCIILTLI